MLRSRYVHIQSRRHFRSALPSVLDAAESYRVQKYYQETKYWQIESGTNGTFLSSKAADQEGKRTVVNQRTHERRDNRTAQNRHNQSCCAKLYLRSKASQGNTVNSREHQGHAAANSYQAVD